MHNKQVVIHEFGGPKVIKIETGPLPEPKPGEVRVRIEATSAGATDTTIRKGIYPLLKDKPPFTLGYDFVGMVDKLGEGVTELKLGDRVADMPQIGANANYICRSASSVICIPNLADAAEAVCLVLAWMTAYQMLTHFAEVQPGHSVLIHGGSGAVGNALLQLGKVIGLRMVATASANKQDMLTAHGATAINYQAGDYEGQLRHAAGVGFDAAFDATHHQSFNHSFRLLKPGGKFITYGTFSMAQSIQKRTAPNFMKFGASFGLLMAKLALWNSLPNGKSARFFGIVDSKTNQPERFRKDLNHLFDLLAQNKIKPTIHERLTLDEAVRAHQLLDAGQVRGQLVFVNSATKRTQINYLKLIRNVSTSQLSDNE